MDFPTQLFGKVDLEVKGYLVYFTFTILHENPVFCANSVDPDQTPRTATIDLGLHCNSLL